MSHLVDEARLEQLRSALSLPVEVESNASVTPDSQIVVHYQLLKHSTVQYSTVHTHTQDVAHNRSSLIIEDPDTHADA